MPSAAFNASLPFILRWEGGFVDHPADPGGRTNKGVTQRVYDAWRRRQGLPQRDVKLIEDGEVHTIYESGYWIPPRCDLLAQPLGLVSAAAVLVSRALSSRRGLPTATEPMLEAPVAGWVVWAPPAGAAGVAGLAAAAAAAAAVAPPPFPAASSSASEGEGAGASGGARAAAAGAAAASAS